MRIEIDKRKSIYENINDIYDEIKKLKKKLDGINRAIEENKKMLENLNIEINKKEIIYNRKKEWYEKYRWFFTSNGFLLIAGKDSITNEVIIRKYLEDNDLVFHSDIHGSPFGILKNGKFASMNDIEEAAKFVGSYSRAWKEGFSSIDVYYVYPNQISKKAPSGMYLKRGSFMIYGNKNYIRVKLEIAIGIKDYQIIPGVPESIEKYCNKYVILIPGNEKPSKIAEKISKIFNIEKDIIIKYIPGNSSIYKIFL